MAGIVRVKYESENAGIIFIEHDPILTPVVGTPPEAAADSSLTAYTSVSRRRNGIHARRLVLTRERGEAPNCFTDRITIPILTLADFAAVGNQPGAIISIDSVDWTVRRQIPEDAV